MNKLWLLGLLLLPACNNEYWYHRKLTQKINALKRIPPEDLKYIKYFKNHGRIRAKTKCIPVNVHGR